MDSQILYTDLFDSEFIGKVTELKNNLQGLTDEIKNLAAATKSELSATSASADAISQLASRVAALEQAYQSAQRAQQATNSVIKGTSTLTDDERQSIEALVKNLENWRLQWATNIKQIDVANKSYNELKASYNAIVEQLNRMTDAERSNTSAGQNMTAQAHEIMNALKNMDNQYKKAAQGANTLSEALRRFPKLQQFEATNIENFTAQVNNLRAATDQTLPAIDMQKKSYNELYATYNVLKDALNGMTTEQRESTAAGQSMTKQAHDLMEQLNKLQQATGKYTLNVGNYASAFDGFGYSIQQVLREIPSATTLNQFFLAISNNIPMVADQIRKFYAEQADLKKRYDAAMLAGNKETADAIATGFMSFGKKLTSSVLNWQSAILGITLLLKTYGSDIWHWFVGLFGKIKELAQKTKDEIDKIGFFAQVRKDVANVKTELELLMQKMDETTKGTDEWRKIILRVNELTKGNLDYIKATPEEVRKVTNAYIEQAKQLAINRRVVEKIAESEENLMIQGDITRILTPLYTKLGRNLVFDKDSPIIKEAIEKTAAAMGIKKETDEFKKWSDAVEKSLTETATKNKRNVLDLMKSWVPTLSDDLRKDYEAMLKPLPEEKTKGDGTKQLKSNFQLLDDMYEEWLENRYKTIQDAFERETAMENDRFELQYRKYIYEYTKRLENLKTALNKGIITQEQYDQHLLDLQEQMGVKVEENYSEQYQKDAAQFKKDLDNKLITEKQYERMMIELQIQHKDEMIVTQTSLYGIIQGITQEHEDKIREIVTKSHKQTLDSLKASEEAKIKAIKDTAETEIQYQKKRVKNAQDEIHNNKIATQNIEVYERAIAKLNEELLKLNALYDALLVKTPFDTEAKQETEKKIKEAIESYQKSINKEITKYSTSQQTKKIGSLWDIVGGGINFSENFKKSVLEKMGIDTGLIQDQKIIDGLFQNWIDETEAAFGDWADKIKDTLSSLLDAWVEYYEAKAAAAAEDTEAAKEEYEKQKALLEAGYASSIEKEWAAYQEKKRIQKQAEKEAELWNERQRQLSQLETVASLGTAIANLFKSLTAGGAVGVAIATAASAALLGAFTQARQQANSVVKYGAGHVETIQGGSHASGHDSPLAYDSQGRERRVEGGEMFAVINRKAVGRYGNGMIEDVINSINAMNYKGVDAVKVAMVGTDLSKIERNLDTLVGNSDGRVMMDADGNMIVKRNNFTKKISFQRTALS